MRLFVTCLAVVFWAVLGVAIWDLTANDNPEAAVGILFAGVGAVSTTAIAVFNIRPPWGH